MCLSAWLRPEEIFGSPPLNLSKAAEISAELKKTIIKFAPKIRIASGRIDCCSSLVSDKFIEPVARIKPNNERTNIAAIIGNKISSLSFFNTLTHDFINCIVFEILPKNPPCTKISSLYNL